MVIPNRLLRFTKTSNIFCLAPTSTPRVGSDTKSSLGSMVKARAIHTFCWFPPLSALTNWWGPRHLMSKSEIIFLL